MLDVLVFILLIVTRLQALHLFSKSYIAWAVCSEIKRNLNGPSKTPPKNLVQTITTFSARLFYKTNNMKDPAPASPSSSVPSSMFPFLSVKRHAAMLCAASGNCWSMKFIKRFTSSRLVTRLASAKKVDLFTSLGIVAITGLPSYVRHTSDFL